MRGQSRCDIHTESSVAAGKLAVTIIAVVVVPPLSSRPNVTESYWYLGASYITTVTSSGAIVTRSNGYHRHIHFVDNQGQ